MPPITFQGRAILLDIEGTTSSIAFVVEEMFPYVRRELENYLQTQWGEPNLRHALDLIAKDAGFPSFQRWRQAQLAGSSDDSLEARRLVQDEVLRLMDGDVKATGLKELQGLIWKSGFESGELQAHVFDDVEPALRKWNDAGLDVRIYSSGSIAAQKLFFGYTIAGNLLGFFRGHYDTTTGPKKEPKSYQTIAADFGLAQEQILFLSDVPAELDAAAQAGMKTALCQRPENAPVEENILYPVITSFHDVHIDVKEPSHTVAEE